MYKFLNVEVTNGGDIVYNFRIGPRVRDIVVGHYKLCYKSYVLIWRSLDAAYTILIVNVFTL